MLRDRDDRIGSEDLEKGMRAGHAREVAVIIVIVLAALLTINSSGLVRWTQSLPSALHTAWLAERAAEWHTLMKRLGPAAHFEKLRER